MCTCRDRPNVSALRASVQPAPRDTLGLAVPRPGNVEAKRADQPDEHLSLQKATRRADVTRSPELPRKATPQAPRTVDRYSPLRPAILRPADVLTALLLVALTGFCGGRFPMEAL